MYSHTRRNPELAQGSREEMPISVVRMMTSSDTKMEWKWPVITMSLYVRSYRYLPSALGVGSGALLENS